VDTVPNCLLFLFYFLEVLSHPTSALLYGVVKKKYM